MDRNVKAKAISILNKLYATFCVVFIGLMIFYNTLDVIHEFKTRAIFNYAHENMEKIVGSKPDTSKLSLLEARELISLEVYLDLSVLDPPGTEKSPLTTDEKYARTCFNAQGEILGSNSSRCLKITDFIPASPYQETFVRLGWIIAVALGLFSIKKWTIWLVK